MPITFWSGAQAVLYGPASAVPPNQNFRLGFYALYLSYTPPEKSANRHVVHPV